MHGPRSMRAGFREELQRLERTLLAEGELVLGTLDRARAVIGERNVAVADALIASDVEVDHLYVQVEEDAQLLLARQTPVASDLRLVLAIVHSNMHLERIADYAVTIAKLTKLAPDVSPGSPLVEGFEETAAQASEMVRVALQSFRERDVDGAESLPQLDDAIDKANRRVVERVLRLGHDPALREWGMRMIVVSGCLERIGDHAVDIGEQTAYLVTGQFREFSNPSGPGSEGSSGP